MDERELKALAIAFREGDQRSFRVLVDSLTRTLIAMAYRYAGDWEWARDLTQETWIKVFRQIGRWDPDRSFSAWLHVIHRNSCLDHLRRGWVRLESTPGEEVLTRLRGSAPGGPEEDLERREFHERLTAALGHLKEIDCQVFEDQLDALLDGSLPDEGIGHLQLHALSCPDCAMLLRVHEHLALPSLEELEAGVPEELVASVWSTVEAEVGPMVEGVVKEGKKEGLGGVSAGTPGVHRFPWLVPTLAAASIALLFSTGFLFSELKRTKARGMELAEQIGALERGFAGLNERTAAVERTAGLAGRNRWVRALSMDLGRRESVSIEWVRQRVGRLPPDTPLFTASEVEALLGGVTSWGFPAFRGEVYDRAGTDGLSAQELLAVFDSLNLPPELTVPASRLRDLLS